MSVNNALCSFVYFFKIIIAKEELQHEDVSWYN